MTDVLHHCESHLDELLAFIETLVRLESPSTDKAAVDRCGRALTDRLRALGGAVDLIPTGGRGDHVRARFGGDGRPVLLLGHFDTVWPLGTLERMPLRRDGSVSTARARST